MRHTLVAVFDNRSDARNALDELLASGFSRDEASLSSADPTGQSNSVTGADTALQGEHEEGIGASIKHFFTSLFGSDTNEHAMKYSYAVTRGHHVLTLTTASEPDVERAAAIIERFGPVDIDDRHDEWTRGAAGMRTGAPDLRQSGSMAAQSGNPGSASGAAQSGGSYQGTPAGTEPGSLQFTGHDDRNYFATQNLNDPVPKDTTYQEPLGANEQSGGSMDSATGGNTLSGTQSSAQNPATGSSLQASQSGSLNRSGSTLQGTASIPGSDDTSLGGTAMMGGQAGSQQRDLGSRGNVRVFSHDTTATTGMRDTDDPEDHYRSHWTDNYSSLGSYDDYAPAYRYGNEMRRSAKYRNRQWYDVESDLKTNWETRHPGVSTWDKFKMAVRHGWERITPDINTDDWYHTDWHDNYSSLGGGYDEYEPAYRYGTEMRTSAKYRDRSWDEVEADLRSDWDKRHPGASTWDKFKAAVRRGWDKITPDIDDDSYYRSHWNARYSNANDTFDNYLPAYRYGDEARRMEKYRSRDWDAAESDLKADWESRYTSAPSTWERFKDAVRHGWNKITPDMDDSTYYHTHYESNYAGAGTDFDEVAPAYRYGNEMRTTDTYRDRSWDDAESDLKNDWHSRYGAHDERSAWERIKAAVRHGWDTMTGETAADDSHYRSHWSNTYAAGGTRYDDMAPAYRYGAEMRNDVRFRNRDWSDVENDLHIDWEERHGRDGASAWDKVKEAVRHGWDRATL